MCSIDARGHPDVCLLEQVIYFELHQHLVAETRAGHTLRGESLLGAMSQGRECLFGQRGAPVGQPSSALPLITLAAALLVGSRVRRSYRLICLGTPFPGREGLRENTLRSPERLHGEVDRPFRDVTPVTPRALGCCPSPGTRGTVP
jgi:hypothetical protein